MSLKKDCLNTAISNNIIFIFTLYLITYVYNYCLNFRYKKYNANLYIKKREIETNFDFYINIFLYSK